MVIIAGGERAVHEIPPISVTFDSTASGNACEYVGGLCMLHTIYHCLW